LAHIGRKYDRGYGHFTTRQNVQFNWPRLAEVPDILAELASVDGTRGVMAYPPRCVRSAIVTSAPTPAPTSVTPQGVALSPFRALRPSVTAARLATLLCPPYDVIDEALRRELIAADPDNAVTVILPEAAGNTERYAAARERMDSWVSSGLFTVDPEPALYVYEMADRDGAVTRGLLGALTLQLEAHLLEGIAGQHHEVELVKDDRGFGEALAGPFHIGGAHIHRNRLDLGGIPAMQA